jgi:hypothetical protein
VLLMVQDRIKHRFTWARNSSSEHKWTWGLNLPALFINGIAASYFVVAAGLLLRGL